MSRSTVYLACFCKDCSRRTDIVLPAAYIIQSVASWAIESNSSRGIGVLIINVHRRACDFVGRVDGN